MDEPAMIVGLMGLVWRDVNESLYGILSREVAARVRECRLKENFTSS